MWLLLSTISGMEEKKIKIGFKLTIKSFQKSSPPAFIQSRTLADEVSTALPVSSITFFQYGSCTNTSSSMSSLECSPTLAKPSPFTEAQSQQFSVIRLLPKVTVRFQSEPTTKIWHSLCCQQGSQTLNQLNKLKTPLFLSSA